MFTLYILYIVYIIMFWCFSLLKNDNFSARNLSSPTVFDQDCWNKHFIWNWKPYTRAVVFFFCSPSVSRKKIRNIKKYARKRKISEKKFKIFFLILFFKNFKNASCDTLFQGFVNEIQSAILFYLWNCRKRLIFWAQKSIHFLCKSFSLRFTEQVSKQTMCGTSSNVCFSLW